MLATLDEPVCVAIQSGRLGVAGRRRCWIGSGVAGGSGGGTDAVSGRIGACAACESVSGTGSPAFAAASAAAMAAGCAKSMPAPSSCGSSAPSPRLSRSTTIVRETVASEPAEVKLIRAGFTVTGRPVKISAEIFLKIIVDLRKRIEYLCVSHIVSLVQRKGGRHGRHDTQS